MPAPFSFQVTARCPQTQGRAGYLQTPHGIIHTPAFMPVGTQATVKALTPDELREMGAEIVLANTYHLYLRPGPEVIQAAGGLHRFMQWHAPLLTDSGGYQVFSLSHQRKIDEEGVTFRSHLDGSLHMLSPEKVIAIQEALGADIIMPLDECTPYPSDHAYNQQALQRTHRWAERSLAAHTRNDQLLFAIVQGGTFPDLRRESASFLRELDFPGYAVGGLSVGEPKEVMNEILDLTVPLLPAEKPRYLMGVGSPEDLVEGVARGIDLFDCVLPTRIARNGAFLVRTGRLNIRNARYKKDFGPVEEGCQCYTCRTFSRAYLRHLFKAEELLAYRLATIHNLFFLLQLMREIRTAILEGRFAAFRTTFLNEFTPIPHAVRQANREARRRSLLRQRER
ncbi:MAG: tRNA guanosine(34) transglycosylase Tgt [Nitrospinota bacterium]|nr:MAG: tRNA guanosine(34) transglycosylase Tgt [Nitrospinota bacterium]